MTSTTYHILKRKLSRKLPTAANMLLQLFVLVALIAAASSRGARTDKDHFALQDDLPDKALQGAPNKNLLDHLGHADHPKPPKEPPAPALEDPPTGDKRRKFPNGRTAHGHFQATTVRAEAGKENGTWNVEKKEKTLDLGKEVIKTCQVTTEELVATAQATVTRALKGLCSSKEMDERLEYLEDSIANHLNTIKQMILNLEEKLSDHGDTVLYGQKQLSAAISKGLTGPLNGNGGPSAPNNDYNNNKNQKTAHEKGTGNGNNGDEEDSSEEQDDVSGTRDPEILKFNSSIHVESSVNGAPKKVFTYYWKIKDMMFKLTGWNPRKSLRSQSFYIFPSGYRMYMRVFPRKNEDNFNVKVGLTKGEFDDSLKWPFPLKHKIHILDQTKEGRLFEDIASRIWDPNLLCSDFNWQKPISGDNHECVEISFPHDVLRQREYIRNDALVIKLTVYLES